MRNTLKNGEKQARAERRGAESNEFNHEGHGEHEVLTLKIGNWNGGKRAPCDGAANRGIEGAAGEPGRSPAPPVALNLV